MLTADKIKGYGALVLILMLVSGFTAWATMERTTTKLNQQHEVETKALQDELHLRVSQLNSQQKSLDTYKSLAQQSFKNKTLQLCDGKPCLDGKGHALYNLDEGESSSSEEFLKQLEATTQKYEFEETELKNLLQAKSIQISQLEQTISKPSFKHYNAGLTWDFPWDGITDTSRARMGLQAGPNFLLGPFVVKSHLGVLLPPFMAWDWGNTQGRLGLGSDF